MEKTESPKGERAVKSVISFPSEKWVLKIGFLKVQNSQQIKEQDKCPPNQTKEEEIGNLPDKEFR